MRSPCSDIVPAVRRRSWRSKPRLCGVAQQLSDFLSVATACCRCAHFALVDRSSRALLPTAKDYCPPLWANLASRYRPITSSLLSCRCQLTALPGNAAPSKPCSHWPRTSCHSPSRRLADSATSDMQKTIKNHGGKTTKIIKSHMAILIDTRWQLEENRCMSEAIYQ